MQQNHEIRQASDTTQEMLENSSAALKYVSYYSSSALTLVSTENGRKTSPAS
jgi:hypothetical protein